MEPVTASRTIESVTKRRVSILITILLSILLFLFTCAFIVLLVLRAGNSARILRNIDITGLFDETDLAYYIEYQLHGLPFNNNEIWFYKVEYLLMSEAATDEIGGVIERYSRALARGDLDYYLTDDDILGILHNLEPELNILFEHQMTEADYEHFVSTLDDILDFRGLTVDGIFVDLEDFGINTTIPRLLLSSFLLWVAGILFTAALFVIFMYNRKRIAYAFLIAGIPVILSGLIYLTIGVIFSYYMELLSDALYSLTRFTDGLAYLFMWHGIVFAVLGLLSVVAYIILKSKTHLSPHTPSVDKSLI